MLKLQQDFCIKLHDLIMRDVEVWFLDECSVSILSFFSYLRGFSSDPLLGAPFKTVDGHGEALLPTAESQEG